MKYWKHAAVLLLALWANVAVAQTTTNDWSAVIFHGQELFRVTNISSRPAAQRVEIMSPHYRAGRDGGKPALPEAPGDAPPA